MTKLIIEFVRRAGDAEVIRVGYKECIMAGLPTEEPERSRELNLRAKYQLVHQRRMIEGWLRELAEISEVEKGNDRRPTD